MSEEKKKPKYRITVKLGIGITDKYNDNLIPAGEVEFKDWVPLGQDPKSYLKVRLREEIQRMDGKIVLDDEPSEEL